MPLVDAHVYIVDPRFPLAGGGYVPEPFTVADYRARTARLGVTGGAVVSGSFRGYDQTYLQAALAALPKLSVDHLGMSAAGRDALLRLVEGGARVKATGFGRVDLDVPATLRAVHAVSPDALMAGTDLPSTRARRPFADADLDLISEQHGGGAAAAAVLHDNARAFYGV